MHNRSWRAALVVAGVMSIAPSIKAQVQGGHAATTAYVAVSFTGEHMGRFPAANCMSDRTKGLLYLTDFVETTSASAPAGFGSFDVQLLGGCATPFFQALFAHERMTVVITFLAPDLEPTLTLSLTNAQLTHAQLSSVSSTSGGAHTARMTPFLQLSIAAPQVAVTAGGVAVAESASPAPAASKSRLPRQLETSTTPPRRMRAPTFRIPESRKLSVASTSPSGGGSGWVGNGMTTAILHLASATLPPVNVQVKASELRVDAGYAADAGSQMPTGPMQITLGPLQKGVDANSAALRNAANAHVSLTQAVLTAMNYMGQPVITLTLHGAKLVSDQIATSAAQNSVATETLQLGLAGLTITDVGSGKTAQSNP